MLQSSHFVRARERIVLLTGNEAAIKLFTVHRRMAGHKEDVEKDRFTYYILFDRVTQRSYVLIVESFGVNMHEGAALGETCGLYRAAEEEVPIDLLPRICRTLPQPLRDYISAWGIDKL
jgi:hypothetical protein